MESKAIDLILEGVRFRLTASLEKGGSGWTSLPSNLLRQVLCYSSQARCLGMSAGSYGATAY